MKKTDKIEGRILELFSFNVNLKFNEIEKQLKIRSNKLTYHLKQLIKKGILEKQNEKYLLSSASEPLIPYLSDKKAMLSVILVHIGDNKKCFLHERKKRPFKCQLGLPGGRPVLGETIKEATIRLMKEKFNIKAKLSEIHSVSIENLKKFRKIIQTDLIIFVSAKTKDKISLMNIEENKNKIITSDYLLLKQNLDKKIDIKTINTRRI